MAPTIIRRLQQKLFRWHSDGKQPIRLGQRRIFIVPAPGGLLFGATLITMHLAAINYDLALGHALVFLLAGVGLVGMLHTFRNLHQLTIQPGRCEPVFAGDLAHFPLELGNDRPMARCGLLFAADPAHPVVTAVAPGDQRKIAIPLPAPRRGRLPLPRVRLSTRYPLGLFTAWSYLQPEMSCLVYPRPLFRPLPPPSAAPQGRQQQGEGGDEDFAGFRERQPADSPRHIAWKVDARLGDSAPHYIKQFAGGAYSELLLDWQQTEGLGDNEERYSILAGWLIQAHGDGLRFALCLPGTRLPPDSGDSHLQRCLEVLALESP